MKKIVLLLLCCALPAWPCEGLTARDAWIREAPPGADVLGGYVSFSNAGASEQSICHAQSAAFGSVEFHQMSMDHGQMQMRELDRLTVPAHGSLALAPGGTHLMLMQPKAPLKAGQKVSIDFYCDGKEHLTVEFQVKSSS
ncbi:MAG TPA: copper chaperone PCu(A)C [Nevskiaceae bacterium]|nr:copper chaperone PCu(A)C [Nevskiaceae bacterium]